MAKFEKAARAARVLAAFSLVFAGAVGCGGSRGDAKSPTAGGRPGPAESGKQAPDLTIRSVDGKRTYTLDARPGKIVVVDFWATWCGPCKQSFPKLEELSKKYSDTVEVIGISVDDEKDGVAEFAKNSGATFLIGWDEGHHIAGRWKVESMPTTYIVDASGVVRFVHAGFHEDEPARIDKEVASLASEPPPAKAAEPKTLVAQAQPPAPPPPSEAASEPAAAPPPPAKPEKKGAAKRGKTKTATPPTEKKPPKGSKKAAC